LTEVPDEGYSRLSNLLTEVPDEGYSRFSNLLTEVPDEGYSRLSNLLTEVPDEGYYLSQKIGKPRITFIRYLIVKRLESLE
jgi:predicted DNA-binding protein